MNAYRLSDGRVLVPTRAESEDGSILGDALLPYAPESEEAKQWARWTLDALPEMEAQFEALGGKGSGNYGHAGRPGERGGSAEGMSDKEFSQAVEAAKSNRHPGTAGASDYAHPVTISRAVYNKYFVHSGGATDVGTGKYKEYSYYTFGKGGSIKIVKREPDEPVPPRAWTKDKALAEAVSKYIWQDAKPKGEIAEKLERAVQKSGEIKKDIVSYRGMRVDNATLKSLTKEGTVISLGHPSSFTNSDSVAWDFAKGTGYRASSGKNALVIEALIPAGTKALFPTSFQLNIGHEHLLSGKTQYVVRSVKPFRGGRKIQVEVLK